MNILQAIITELAETLRPLVRAFKSADEFADLLRRFGWLVDESSVNLTQVKGAFAFLPLLTNLETLLEEFKSADEDRMIELAGELTSLLPDLFSALKNLESQVTAAQLPAPLNDPACLQTFGTQLFDSLIAARLRHSHTFIFACLNLFGIIEPKVVPDDRDDAYPVTYDTIRWKTLLELFQDPKAVLKRRYAWNDPAYDFKWKDLLENLQRLFMSLGIPARIVAPPPSLSDRYYSDAVFASGEIKHLRIPLYDAYSQDIQAAAEVALILFPIPPAGQPDGKPSGLVAGPYLDGHAALDIPLGESLALKLCAGLETGLGVEFRPGSVAFRNDLFKSANSTGAYHFSGEVKLTRADAVKKLILLGTENQTHFELGNFHVLVGLEGTLADPSVTVEAGLSQAAIVIQAGEGDSFLKSVLSDKPLAFGFDITVGYSTQHGFYLKGGAGLEYTFNLNQSIGPLFVNTVGLKLAAKETGLCFQAMVTGGFVLGPISATVQNVGMETKLLFDRPGLLGDADLALGFKPPDGLALAIKASVVKGGGYLMFDPEKGEYAGALELSFQNKFVFTAVGVLTTKFPDGSEGYSLLIIICAQFPPITLGFGFFLNGLGGLLGLHRTMDVDAMREGVKQGTVDNILFPTNIIENIIKIISDIKAIFPVARDQFVVGPMALITWGAQPILSVKLGIVIELSHPTRLNILGVLRVALPQGVDSPLIQLQVNFFGSLDFQKGTLTFDASLFDSYIGTSGFKFKLEGDMALRIFWGEQKEFLLSVGGFHPAFHPAACLKVDKMKRLTISLLSGNPHLTLTTYFAVTSNTVQFGAAIDFYFSIASFSVEGYFGFDALFQFSPFHMIVGMEARLAVKCGGCELFAIGLSFELEGPAPWHAKGKAKFKILFFSYTARFNKTFGEEQNTVLPLEPVLPALLSALREDRAWQGEIPEGSFTTVSVRTPDDPEVGILLQGNGVLTIRQNIVPLDTEISRFGPNPPADIKQAKIAEVRLGHAAQGDGSLGKKLTLAQVQELFAPANFKDMSDDDKLKSPSFSLMNSGVKATGSDEVSVTYGRNRPVEYELMLSDEDPAPDGSVVSKPVSVGMRNPGKARFTPYILGGGVGRSPLSKAHRLRRQVLDHKRVQIAPEAFAVVFKQNLQPCPGAFVQGTRDEADKQLKALVKQQPELADKIQLVSKYQAV